MAVVEGDGRGIDRGERGDQGTKDTTLDGGTANMRWFATDLEERAEYGWAMMPVAVLFYNILTKL
jgi:hypothetical protein